jgi:hypothetical protein
MFDGDVFTIEDQRFDYGETRYVTFELLKFRVMDIRQIRKITVKTGRDMTARGFAIRLLLH